VLQDRTDPKVHKDKRDSKEIEAPLDLQDLLVPMVPLDRQGPEDLQALQGQLAPPVSRVNRVLLDQQALLAHQDHLDRLDLRENKGKMDLLVHQDLQVRLVKVALRVQQVLLGLTDRMDPSAPGGKQGRMDLLALEVLQDLTGHVDLLDLEGPMARLESQDRQDLQVQMDPEDPQDLRDLLVPRVLPEALGP